MAVFAASTTKEINWRGSLARVSNVYHYKSDALETFDDLAVLTELVRLEKNAAGGGVNFVEGRTWGPTDQGQAASKMREIKTFTDSGLMAATTSFYPELAVMIYWPLGRYGVRNHPQFLRKWYHWNRTTGLIPDGSRTTAAPPAEVQALIDGVTVVRTSGGTQEYELCTKNGEHLPTGPGLRYPYLEHRQIGR